mmetsp:Transcript_2865/g.6374  ORF Transcript_2865/g.6374 Transcript_2865/m.6374 type:complete len:113 (+) Transcript_2865:151-489(+)
MYTSSISSDDDVIIGWATVRLRRSTPLLRAAFAGVTKNDNDAGDAGDDGDLADDIDVQWAAAQPGSTVHVAAAMANNAANQFEIMIYIHIRCRCARCVYEFSLSPSPYIEIW